MTSKQTTPTPTTTANEDNNNNPSSSPRSTTTHQQPTRRKNRRITKKGRELQRKHLRENQTVVRWEPGGLFISRAFRVGVLGVERTVSVTVPVSWRGVWGVVVAVSVGGLFGVLRGLIMGG